MCAQVANTEGSVTQSDELRPKLWGLVVLALPAFVLGTYPLAWLEAETQPSSRLWYVAEYASWLAVFSPVSLFVLLLTWRQLDPRKKAQRFAASIVFTLFIVLQMFGFISTLIFRLAEDTQWPRRRNPTVNAVVVMSARISCFYSWRFQVPFF